MGEAVVLEERYTYGDYKTWDDEFRWELIDGKAFCMGFGPKPRKQKSLGATDERIVGISPGPGEVHQSLSAELTAELRAYFKGKECRIYAAPFDVMLQSGDESESAVGTVVQPDIMIVCDKSKIQHNGIKGAPDVVFEILSPSTARHDLADKFNLYERAGVKEYVIADPQNRVMIAYRRDEAGRYSVKYVYGTDDVLEFAMFPELKIPLNPIWEYIRELPMS